MYKIIERESGKIVGEIPEDHWSIKKKNGNTVYCQFHLEEKLNYKK